MALIQMTVLSGVPCRSRNFLAKHSFVRTRLSCARFWGWESPQKHLQALYPVGQGAGAASSSPCGFPLASAHHDLS